MSSLPLWLRAAGTLGIPGVIALFLVWVGSNELPRVARQTQLNSEAIQQLQEQTRQLIEQNAAVYRLQQRICANTARNEDERNHCFDK